MLTSHDSLGIPLLASGALQWQYAQRYRHEPVVSLYHMIDGIPTLFTSGEKFDFVTQ